MINTNFIPYGKQTITQQDIDSVVEVLKSPFLTQGPVVPQFEKIFSTFTASSFSVACNSATSALHLACHAIGLKSNDLLWTSPITFVASANCARYCGADVGFVDIDPTTALIDVNQLEKQLLIADRRGRLPKVIVPVHLTGTSCDMVGIKELADRYDIYLIEDASHAVGASYMNAPVGNCIYSDISVFSFHPVKIITTAEGGIATTNNPLFAERMVSTRSHGIQRNSDKFEYHNCGPWYYEQQELGFNYRLTELQAALGLSQLQRLESIVDERNRLLSNYKRLMADLPVTFLSIPPSCHSSVHLAVILLRSGDPDHHKRIFDGFRAAGIGVQLHYLPVHLHPYYRRLGWSIGDFPIAESYSSRAISIPLFPGLTDSQQTRITSVLSSLL